MTTTNGFATPAASPSEPTVITGPGFRLLLPFPVARERIIVDGRPVSVVHAAEDPLALWWQRRESPFNGDTRILGLAGMIAHSWESRAPLTGHTASRLTTAQGDPGVLHRFTSGGTRPQQVTLVVIDDGQPEVLVFEAIHPTNARSHPVQSWLPALLASIERVPVDAPASDATIELGDNR